METPRELLARTLSTATKQVSKRSLEVVAEIISKHGNAEGFMVKFNPSNNDMYCRKFLDRCFIGNAPTLYWAERAYGENVILSWLQIQLSSIIAGQNVAAEKMMTPEQLADTSRTILGKYGFLKVTEFIVFTREVKAGSYGTAIKAISQQDIGAWLKQFLEYRKQKLDSLEREARQLRLDAHAQRIKEGKTMNREEWERFKAMYPEKLALLAKICDISDENVRYEQQAAIIK